jgi:hypothetical protein
VGRCSPQRLKSFGWLNGWSSTLDCSMMTSKYDGPHRPTLKRGPRFRHSSVRHIKITAARKKLHNKQATTLLMQYLVRTCVLSHPISTCIQNLMAHTCSGQLKLGPPAGPRTQDPVVTVISLQIEDKVAHDVFWFWITPITPYHYSCDSWLIKNLFKKIQVVFTVNTVYFFLMAIFVTINN